VFFSIPEFSPVRRTQWAFPVSTLAYNPAGDRVAAFGWRPRQLEVRDARDEKFRLSMSGLPDQRLMGLAWSPDGRMLAAGCANFRGFVWSAETGQRLAELVGHHAEVVGCDFGPDGAWLATSSWDGTTRFWDPVTGNYLLTAVGNVTTADPNGWWLAIRRGDSTPVLWVDDRPEHRSLHAHTGGKGPWHVSFDVHGRVLASTSPDAVRFWDPGSGRALGELTVAGGPLAAIFHPNDRTLVSSGYKHCSRWPIEFDEPARTLRIRPAEALLPESLTKVATERRISMSADGSRIAVSDQLRGRIDVVSYESPALRRDVGPIPDLAGAILSPDGRWVVGQTWPNPRGRVWDAVTGAVAKDLTLPRQSGHAFSPDSRYLYVGSERGAEVLAVGTWKKVRAIPADVTGIGAGHPTVSPDGRLLAVSRRAALEIQLLDAATLNEIARLVSVDPQPITHMAFSPDSRRLAVACSTHVVQLWDLGRIRQRLKDLNLDWDHPDYPAAAEEAPWRLEVPAIAKAPAPK
jgi:WD40 repeat protein